MPSALVKVVVAVAVIAVSVWAVWAFTDIFDPPPPKVVDYYYTVEGGGLNATVEIRKKADDSIVHTINVQKNKTGQRSNLIVAQTRDAEGNMVAEVRYNTFEQQVRGVAYLGDNLPRDKNAN